MVADIDEIESALSIPIPQTDDLQLVDSRRLTGPGLLWDHAGAVLDVEFSDFDAAHVITLWQEQARRILDAIGWSAEKSISRQFDVGVNLAISAPMDQLYSATFVAQTIWHFCAAELLNQHPGDFAAMITDLKRVMAMEANPPLVALISAAAEHRVDVLTDDDVLSLGHGTGSQLWSVSKLPAPEDVDWSALYDVPVALITGTNGKTTTTRLSAAIAKAAGKTAGLTSTEFVRVGEDILDYGDYSGPGGARMLLRDKRLEIAYLEVARGGILRRGLPLRRARAAVVTNVAADHLGQYGVNTVADLAVAKFAVHRTLADDGVLILNADDAYVRAQARVTQASIWWFSLDSENTEIANARNSGQPCAWLEDAALHFFDGQGIGRLIDVADIPITMNGAAGYNILNALGAICLSYAMVIPENAMVAGLSGFQNNAKDNPGRCNEFSVNGARVFVDFAHNPHSIAAVVGAMTALPAKRRFILLSHAGDRSDQEIRDVTATGLQLKPDYIAAAENPDYLRGRELGEITALIRDESLARGLSLDQVLMSGSPLEGAEKILDRVRPGDLALLLVLADRDQVLDLLARRVD